MAGLGRIDRRTYDRIQREQSRRTVLLFLLLLGVYTLAVLIGYLSLKGIFFAWTPTRTLGEDPFFGWKDLGLVLFISLASVVAHWISARANATDRLLALVGARPLDDDDRYHRRFARVVDELRAACGLPPIRCVVIGNATANAFAIDDSKAQPVIGVTEGLLARLSRPQLQAVCAHEVAHVLRQDCRLATLVCALVGIIVTLLEAQMPTDVEGRQQFTPLYPVFWLLALVAHLLNLAISRKREYLADATAVELTRDPLALADALKRIARAPRGAAPDGLAPLFIAGTASEETGTDWAATHPPLEARIAALLESAGLGPRQAAQAAQAEVSARATGTAPTRYHAFDESSRQWVGPAAPAELAGYEWLGPVTWIAPEGGGPAVPAGTVEALHAALYGSPGLSGGACPRCAATLVEEEYEGTQVERCARCGGCLVQEGRVARILVRRDAPLGPEARRLAGQFRQATRLRPRRQGAPLAVGLLAPTCPHCGREMFTRFYSYQYFVEIDRCGACKQIWFDRDELEILQALVEGTTETEPEPAG